MALVNLESGSTLDSEYALYFTCHHFKIQLCGLLNMYSFLASKSMASILNFMTALVSLS